MAGFEQNAAAHNELAAEYDAHLSGNPHNGLARRAFVELVARHVPEGSTLLDFGCGTGIDALDYASRGYRVLAYDNSPGMLAQLARRCQAEIVSGAITPCSVGYSSFLDRFPQWPAPEAVVSNFGVLNSIPDLAQLFDTFAQRLAPPGWMIVSILNPIHWKELKTSRWWRGSHIYATLPYTTYSHSVSAVRRAARSFQLVGRANAGALVRYDGAGQRLGWGEAGRLRRAIWRTPAHRLLGHFVFLVFRRDP
jgi:SAM-dependent methyltransferase